MILSVAPHDLCCQKLLKNEILDSFYHQTSFSYRVNHSKAKT